MKPRLNKCGIYFLAGTSIFACAVAGSASAQTPEKPTAAPTDVEIIVTGTRIRGVAAVGSATIPIDRATILERATGSTNDILRDVPQVTNFGASGSVVGGPQVQNSSLNNTYANSINLRGLGTTATLTLVDGHRVAPSGGGGGYTDTDIIPAIVLERIEVVADGSSAIYGSDAVAGVVNLRLRAPFTGAETAVGTGLSRGTRTFKASQLLGYRWDRGGFVVALEHSTQTALAAADRPNLYNDDLTPYGGAAVSNVAFPGNVSTGGLVYAIPAGQNGQGFTLSRLGAAGAPNRQSVWFGVDALPKQRRDTALVKYDWQLTDDIKFFGYGVYTDRNVSAKLAAASSNGYTVPSTNPFSPCAAGVNRTNSVGVACPANGNLTVIYSWYGDLGNSVRTASETAMDFTNGFELQLPADWKATVAGTYGRTKNTQSATTVNNNAVAVLLSAPGAVVNVTVPGIGSVAITHPTNIPSLNLFCGVPPCNDAASLAYISTANGNEAASIRKDVTFGADGPLFTLPGGKVRLAVGAEYIYDYMYNNSTNLTSTASVTSTPITLPTSVKRKVTSVYSELYVPLVGADNAMTLVQKLDLSLAARYDHYSDFGGTLNPKFGLNWMPINGLALRATYGTSFRAPTPAETNPFAGANIIPERAILGSQVTGASNIVAGNNYTALTTIGGHVGLNAETAKTFSLGFEFKPPSARGLNLSLNYYNLVYKNRIETPANSAGFPANLNASPLYDSFFIYNPTFYPTRSTVTQAQFNALLAAKLASTTPALTPPAASTGILALIDGTRANSGALSTAGFDLAARYTWGNSSRWNIGATATYVLNYKYSPVPGAPTLDYVNTFSTIGSPLRLRGRGQIGWSGHGISATLFANYQNGYNFPNGINFPVNLLPAGVTAANYGKIASRTTFDLGLSYDTGDRNSILKNIAFRVFAANMFDKDPPFVLNGTIQYDPTQASQVGRTVSLQITKRW